MFQFMTSPTHDKLPYQRTTRPCISNHITITINNLGLAIFKVNRLDSLIYQQVLLVSSLHSFFFYCILFNPLRFLSPSKRKPRSMTRLFIVYCVLNRFCVLGFWVYVDASLAEKYDTFNSDNQMPPGRATECNIVVRRNKRTNMASNDTDESKLHWSC